MMPALPKTIRVLLVEDHEVTRVGLRTILGNFPELEVVGESGTAADALAATQRLKPDLVLLDVRLPDQTGYEVCRQIHQLGGPTRVLILTSYADEDTVFRCLDAGAEGFLLKEINAEALTRAIRDVAAGKAVLDPTITSQVLTRFRSPPESRKKSRLDLLSAQERRVLELVAKGKTNKEIGLELGLSSKTVKNYFSNILDKLQMNRRSAAAVFYMEQTAAQEAQGRPGNP
jgi:two-component system response regulator DevR